MIFLLVVLLLASLCVESLIRCNTITKCNSFKGPQPFLHAPQGSPSAFCRKRPLQAVKSQQKIQKAVESGASIEIINANLCIGSNDIISNINWSIMPRERWALVGENGAGKHIFCIV
jgi:ABC-type multidrug transport system fused ATPase/permease subunit